MDNFKKLLSGAALAILSTTLYAATPQFDYPHQAFRMNKEVNQFIRAAVKQYHFKKTRLVTLLHQAQYIPGVIARMKKPYEAKPWSFYRRYFITPERITNGAAYWKKHAAILTKIQQQFGVPASLIVAIIGVETNYGSNLGKYQELGALATLAFHYPKRARFFSKELLQYLLLAKEENLALLTTTGSYAGALGIPQFMPSSYRHYGISLNGSKVDLIGNQNNAIASIANYLKKHGWQRDQPITEPSQAQKMTQHIIALQGDTKQEYWRIFKNFSVIMSYNNSSNYAMAAYQLSRAISKAYGSTKTKSGTATPAAR